MSLSCASPGVKPTGASFSWTLRSAGRIRSGVRMRCVVARSRVLNAESLELTQPKDTVDADRLVIELAYAQSKVQDVQELHTMAEQQLEELLDLFGERKQKSKSKPKKKAVEQKAVAEPTIVVHRKMEWAQGQAADVFVKTTREEAFQKNRKRSKKTLPEASDYQDLITSPFTRDKAMRLLTADEEKELAIQIQRMIRIDDFRMHFFVDHGRLPSWSELAEDQEERVVDLMRDYQKGREAKQTMIERNMRLVVSIAARMRPEGHHLHDLVVDGTAGLVRAIEKFDPEKGNKLSTYAHWWIKQGIQRALNENSRIVKCPLGQNVTQYISGVIVMAGCRVMWQRISRS